MTHAVQVEQVETGVLAYLKNLIPTNEPVLAVTYTAGVLTFILGLLVTHHVIPVSVTTSPFEQQILPVIAGGIVGIVGHFARPLVTPNAKVPKALESAVVSVENFVKGVIDGSDGFPVPSSNTAVVVAGQGAAAVTETDPATTSGAATVVPATT